MNFYFEFNYVFFVFKKMIQKKKNDPVPKHFEIFFFLLNVLNAWPSSQLVNPKAWDVWKLYPIYQG